MHSAQRGDIKISFCNFICRDILHGDLHLYYVNGGNESSTVGAGLLKLKRILKKLLFCFDNQVDQLRIYGGREVSRRFLFIFG